TRSSVDWSSDVCSSELLRQRWKKSKTRKTLGYYLAEGDRFRRAEFGILAQVVAQGFPGLAFLPALAQVDFDQLFEGGAAVGSVEDGKSSGSGRRRGWRF